MNTFNFTHKNSSAVLTLSADNDQDAWFLFSTLIDKDFQAEFRMELIDDLPF